MADMVYFTYLVTAYFLCLNLISLVSISISYAICHCHHLNQGQVYDMRMCGQSEHITRRIIMHIKSQAGV